MDKPQALIVDDNRDVALYYRTVLNMEGIQCDLAGSAKQGLYRLAVSQPDLILLDMRLRSDIGGDDILLQIRSNPRFDRAQVIVVTAYPEMVEPVKHLADLVLLKPVDVEQLRALSARLTAVSQEEKPLYFRDPATELYNRQFYLTRLEQAVERARRRSDFLFATLYFTFGPADQGEQDLAPEERRMAMRGVAERLRRSYRPTDTLARWNGDHFATLHEELKHPDNVNVLVKRLSDEMQPPVDVNGRPRRLAPRFNAILHSRQVSQTEDILRAALQSWQGVEPPPSET